MTVIQAPPTTALVLVDIQNDFLPPNGSLAVPLGQKILPYVMKLLDNYGWSLVVASQDCTSNILALGALISGHEIYQPIKIDAPYQEGKITQVLWPDHCVQSTEGAKLEAGLEARLKALQETGTKGKDLEVDAYSAFADNVYATFTETAKILHENKIEQIVLVGEFRLAADYCVRFSAIDSRKFGFDTILITDATRAVSQDPKDVTAIFADLKARGVRNMTFDEFIDEFKGSPVDRETWARYLWTSFQRLVGLPASKM
ncbi:hypothetical protein FRB96_006270 [Tulasnella sp. 330]|nr:hypothetical protein FRB96_006270 [Tulasnella sp. 330]KAG8885124.1 hypothetical protein FRB97_002290 [Tulasnella sp. 331]